jgi:hypothetical protein
MIEWDADKENSPFPEGNYEPEKKVKPVKIVESKVSEKTLKKRLESDAAKKMVRELCEKYPTVRGDYRILTWRYLSDFRGCKMSFPEFEDFFVGLRGSFSPDTVGRRYRELVQEQQEKLKNAELDGDEVAKQDAVTELKFLLPTPETLAKRKLNRKVYRAFFSQHKIEFPEYSAFW